MSAIDLSVPQFRPVIETEQDRRKYQRVDLELGGCFLDDASEDHQLITENLSCSGAYLRAATVPEAGANVICYFDDLGRVAGTVVRTSKDGFAVEFNVVPHKRKKLADRLSWLINKDLIEVPEQRAAARFPTGGPAFIGRKDGLQIPCTVVDISLTGASFETNGQFQPPPIGEVVTAGNLRGRVVRSGENEFAVNFLRPDEDDV
ncbi:MAG: PilZ domain-containing protein [Hyphomonas sp.]|jgi:hypothetical protein|uniref:PilZ domain-containing protein n=1 Tax=Hyphomonas sp. TaxID=87 RepID=UPI0032638A0C